VLITVSSPILSRSTFVVIARLRVAANAVPKSVLAVSATASYRGISTKPKTRRIRVLKVK
jgi:hypothetical protein